MKRLQLDHKPYIRGRRDLILVNGDDGFIGSNFILDWMATEAVPVLNMKKLTYADNPDNLASLEHDRNYCLVQGDIAD
ncbi:MAG TPA: hypothetical protein VHE58_03990 [Burkholderiales bacterium]|nr:hypothetical protein [Burkholderiales bacterium]